MENNISITQTLDMLKDYKPPKTRQHIAKLCITGRIPSIKDESGAWLIDKGYVDKSIKARGEYVSIDELISDGLTDLPEDIAKNCRRVIGRDLSGYYVESEELLLFAGSLISKVDEEIVKAAIDKIIADYKAKESMVPIAKAAEILGISVFKLKNEIKAGNLRSTIIKNNHYITKEDIERYKAKRHEYASIYELAKELLKDITTAFDIEDDYQRTVLHNCIRQSVLSSVLVPWEQMGLHDDRRNALYVPVCFKEQAVEAITDFLQKYGKTEERIDSYINDRYWETHPVTFKAIKDFSDKKTALGIAALMETFINTGVPEITECSNEDIDILIKYTKDNRAQIYSNYLIMFVNYISNGYEHRYSINLLDDKKTKKKNCTNTRPYTLSQYMAGAYMAFNEEYIKEHDLIKKALDSIHFAVLWLYFIWHYVGAWRTSDIFNIQILKLPFSNEEIRKDIESGTYNEKAVFVSMMLERDINDRYTKAHKSADRQEGNFITVVFSESLKSVIGTVYSICCISTDEEHIPKFGFTKCEYKNFFGDEYIRIFGNYPLSNRRMNKAFLDAIAEITEMGSDSANKVMGYTVAQFARGHASSEWKLADVTSKYLACKMDGLSKDEVMMQLWETGACSFVVSMLLEIVYGEKYSSLPVQYQTQAIMGTGLSAYQAETLSIVLRRAYSRAEYIMDSIFKEYTNSVKREMAKLAIDKIISRQAGCKQKGVICLMTAIGKPCAYRSLEDGFGCPYAIYERSYFFFAIEKLKEAKMKLYNAKTQGERAKIQGLIEEVYLPVIYEIMAFSKQSYGMDISCYKSEVLSILGRSAYVETNEKE